MSADGAFELRISDSLFFPFWVVLEGDDFDEFAFPLVGRLGDNASPSELPDVIVVWDCF